ncbi:MAG TPA: YbaK/EbsC family protein [Thermoanaerobaculia bacterium]|nr:YbaK/EbsC family protein [Thermoanaerobaculia bacterium]
MLDAVGEAIKQLGIVCEVVHCDPNLADTEAFCATYGIPRENAANAILVVAKSEPKKYVVCVVLATTKIDVNHKVSKLLGVRRLSFASADETKEVTGQMIGGVTVFALSVPLYIDSRVMERPWVIVGGGDRSTKLKLAPAELLKIPGASVAAIAVPR